MGTTEPRLQASKWLDERQREEDAAMSDLDVIVVGSGPAGENAAWYARERGLTVALVESELVGGECSYNRSRYSVAPGT